MTATTPGLRLGPLLRYVDWETGTTATVWVEADGPRTAEIRCADGAGGSATTFRIAGHHYALVEVTGLTPGTTTAYEVLLDGHRVWPEPGSAFPPSTVTAPAVPAPGVTVAFGSCRWAAQPTDGPDPLGGDALDALAGRLATDPAAVRPDVLLLLGDQVYADEVSPATRDWLAGRRDLREAPGAQVTGYEEYTRLYEESWRDPEVRWLLSTVPSCMIFDDHDVIDDWNTSAAWVTRMRATPWWHKRVTGALMSYWVHQHLGNLSPAELAADPLWNTVRTAPDGTTALRDFAELAEADPATARWSYRRDFGRTRLVMVDTRAGRALEEGSRSMLGPAEERWLDEQTPAARGSYDHLLIGTSLPWLLPPLAHDLEGWDAALCRGARGGPDGSWARLGEWLRRRFDLEHWSAFPVSFARLARLIARAGGGPGAPATVCVLSGDVHHGYVAEPRWPGGTGPVARVAQLTCSPLHNSISGTIRWGMVLGWTRAGRICGGLLARHGRTAPPPVRWRRTGGPWFGNQLMTLTLRGRSARLRVERVGPPGAGLVTVEERELSAGGGGRSRPGA
ncbi:alkaline phosphatase D family protein [Streptomyces yaizuensis]|uniref:Alkaline phosphatase family protein n=1 Tax=Streptomyces yaizuensis TaxID=2989713 RepID=A0ABQ5NU69_9ACTN|nr:alkaline phosphatase D family protein [Streptomyces sp. YSPA8]GLF93904.1 alkaline phosphatase family protein [Streptomyces sp. YSPA8]